MGKDPWWDWVRLSLEEPYAYPEPIEPGTLVHATAALQTIFYKLVQLNGHRLTSLERQIVGNVYLPRYCIVNRQYPDGRYEVFFLTTFGKAVDPKNLNPVARFFGIPLHPALHESPDMPPLRLESEWTFQPQEPPFVFGIPAVIESYDHPRGSPVRLAKGELDRLNGNVDLRMQRFPYIQGQLRKTYFNWKIDIIKTKRESATRALFKTPGLNKIVKIVPQKSAGDGTWALRSLKPRDLLSRLPFLKNYRLHPQNVRPIPKPYYSPRLRMCAALITRIVR